MNMMDMAKMEEAADEAVKQHDFDAKYSHPTVFIKKTFRGGFFAGAAWAIRQAETQGSSQAVGNISHYPAAVEEPEEEV